jgi:hypothetical protein
MRKAPTVEPAKDFAQFEVLTGRLWGIMMVVGKKGADHD